MTKHRLKTSPFLAVAVVAALGMGLAGCGSSGSDSAADATPPPPPDPTPQEVCEAADGRWNSDASCTSAAELAVERQHMAVSDAIAAAKAAVDGLSAMSSDAEVEAADGLIAAAKTALGEADLLSANQVFVLSGDLTAVETTLASTQTDIDDHRQMVADHQQLMSDQRMAANTAIDTANTAVAGLSATSTDADVTAAKDAIQAAKDAVTSATALSMADRDGLNGRISTIETMLAGTETDIDDHRQMVADDQQRMGVSDAIDAAMAAVGDLDAMSSDEEVNAAKALIATAKTALSDATSVLTADQALALNARISTIETTLETTETAIATQRDQVEEDAETQRVADVGAARMNAMQSYMAADADAKKAEAAAIAAEETSPGSPGAMAARTAADAARTAADAAKTAHDAIMDDMTKAEADAQAAEAATQAGNANTQYAAAKRENDTIQTAKDTTDEQNRLRDVANATDAASDAAMAARSAATTARENATKAREAATDANAAYMRAVAARTNSSAAETQADAAAAAATAAETAATAAEMAADAAEAAHMGIDPAGSGTDAQTAQNTAETKQGEAETAEGTASTQYMAASTASGEAATAADSHVLTLFMAANGAHVMDDAMTDANETADHVTSVGAAMALIAAADNGNQAASTTATATWPGDTVENPATEAVDFAEGIFSFTVNVAGTTSITSVLRESRAAVDLNDDGDMTDDGEARIIQTAKAIADLGVFRGYDLWEDDGEATTNTDRARVIVFTNKQKGDDSKLTVAGGAARSVNGQAVTNSELSNVRGSGNTITGVTWTPSGEAPLMGTLTCGDTCNIVLGEDGAVTTIEGYTFTGSRATVEAVTAADATENNDYLAFGIWSEESDDGETDTFGAFANGGTDYAVNVQNAVTGMATYTGNAAGAHHRTGDRVNWFHGDASLTANFGNATAAGTVSGEISNIRVAGGRSDVGLDLPRRS